MADLGIKILAIGLSLEEEHAIMTAWERDRGIVPSPYATRRGKRQSLRLHRHQHANQLINIRIRVGARISRILAPRILGPGRRDI